MDKRFLLAVVGMVAVTLFTGLQLVTGDSLAQSGVVISFGDVTGWGCEGGGNYANVVQTSGINWTQIEVDLYRGGNYAKCYPSVPISVTGMTYVYEDPIVTKSTWTGDSSALYDGYRHYYLHKTQFPNNGIVDSANLVGNTWTVTQHGFTSGGSTTEISWAEFNDDLGFAPGADSQWYHYTWRFEIVSIAGVTLSYIPTATPIPQGAMPCITGTVGLTPTVQPTMTPMYAATSTPGGPPTPTPTPTATRDLAPPPGGPTPTPFYVDPGYDSGVMQFTTGLEKLSAVGGVNGGDGSNFVQWDATLGQDGEPGVAMLHAFMADEVVTSTVDGNLVAVFNFPGGWDAPIAVSWWARTAYTLTENETHSMRVWYLDSNYNEEGHQMWIAATSGVYDKLLSNSWRKFGVVVDPAEAPGGRITAIAFSDSYLSDHFSSTHPCPSEHGCLYLDDLRVTDGAANQLQFPICEGSEGGGDLGTGTHVCTLAVNDIDVMGEICPQPTSALDIGGWLSWLGCSLKTYFTILPENSRQVDAVSNYSNGIEPFGSIRETREGMAYVQTNLVQYSARYGLYTRSTTDWSKFFNWAILEHFQFPSPSEVVASTSYDASNCEFAQLNPDVPSDILQSTCFIESFATDSGLLAPVQIMIDLFCVAAVFMYVRSNWMAGGSGGEE